MPPACSYGPGSWREGLRRALLAANGAGSYHSSFLSTLGRAMSHQILLLLAVLTPGLAISQRRDQVPCRTVRHSAGRAMVPILPLGGGGPRSKG